MRDAPSIPIVCAAGRGRRHGPRLRPRGHGAGARRCCPPASTYCQDALDAARRRRCAGADHRVERVPRAGAGAAARERCADGSSSTCATSTTRSAMRESRLLLPLHWASVNDLLIIAAEGGGMDDAPRLTVCVCTHDRPAYLRACLDSLRRQTVRADRFEVLVVDSASAAVAEREVARLVLGAPNFRHLRVERPGVSLARNVAARCASAAWIAYIDDDAIAEPNWVSAIFDVIEAPGPPSLIGGRILPLWEVPLPSWWPERLARRAGDHRARRTGRIPNQGAAARRRALRRQHGGQRRRAAGGGRLCARHRPLRRRVAVRRGGSARLALAERRAVRPPRPAHRRRHQIQASRLNPAWLLRRLSGRAPPRSSSPPAGGA